MGNEATKERRDYRRDIAADFTPEGEIVLKALEVHRLHLESHECKKCLSSYETVLNAITAWVKLESKTEVKDDEQKETPKEEGQGASTRAEHGSASTQNQKSGKEKDPLAIFR